MAIEERLAGRVQHRQVERAGQLQHLLYQVHVWALDVILTVEQQAFLQR